MHMVAVLAVEWPWSALTGPFLTLLAQTSVEQWRSQETAGARAHHGHTCTTFVGSLAPNEETKLGGLGGCSPRKFWNF